MSAIEPKSEWDESAPPLTGPDGFEYQGLPQVARDGLQELWTGRPDAERREQLREWDAKVRLCIKLGQAACPHPPRDRKEQEARMARRGPVAQQRSTGWGQEERPVGQRGAGGYSSFGGWGDRAGVAQKPVKAEWAIPGSEPVPGAAPKPKEKKAKQPKEPKEPKKPKQDGAAAEGAGAEGPADDAAPASVGAAAPAEGAGKKGAKKQKAKGAAGAESSAPQPGSPAAAGDQHPPAARGQSPAADGPAEAAAPEPAGADDFDFSTRQYKNVSKALSGLVKKRDRAVKEGKDAAELIAEVAYLEGLKSSGITKQAGQ
eukprot:TRINITY_DN23006_c0_g1_i1.p1 TRINITY_DN23006_c0_g1~~TRINITY_DN23006_c0_g1_i1.p1  ORF type:complete len:344 (+),score=110.54 TRINITY_DN23006_c0_g1_i1:87-1034(+)